MGKLTDAEKAEWNTLKEICSNMFGDSDLDPAEWNTETGPLLERLKMLNRKMYILDDPHADRGCDM